jgi:hypothetical protein
MIYMNATDVFNDLHGDSAFKPQWDASVREEEPCP